MIDLNDDKIGALTAAIQGGLYVRNPQASVVQVSAVLASAVGVRAQVTVPWSDWLERVHPDDLAQLLSAHDWALAEPGKPVELEYRLTTATGKIETVRERVVFLRDSPAPEGVFASHVLPLAQPRGETSEAPATTGPILAQHSVAVVAHELRNPLAAIVTALQLMERKAPEHATNERAIISRQVRNMTRLVEDLLGLATQKAERSVSEHALVDVGELVKQAVEMVSGSLAEKPQHDIEAKIESALFVSGQSFRLGQVVSNLLTNAIKYTPKGGKILVEAYKDGPDAVQIVVSDNGQGIPAEQQANLFHPFVQGTASGVIGRGVGLGLAIVQTLVAMHGGSVKVQSAGLGSGSKFIVRLPAGHEPHALPKPLTASEAASHGGLPSCDQRRILIVDDNVDAADCLADLLRTFNHDVEVAYDGAEAIRCVGSFRPDIAFVDLSLPDTDGVTLAKRIQIAPHSQNVVLVALTGHALDGDDRRAAQAVFAELTLKPAKISEIVALINKWAPRP